MSRNITDSSNQSSKTNNSNSNTTTTQTNTDRKFGATYGELPSLYARLPTRAVFDKKLHPTSFKVLAIIACYANNQGIAWPNATTIAKVVGITTRQVSTHKTKLKARGYIRELSRYRSRFPRIMGSVWRIIFDETLDDDVLIGEWLNEDNTGVATQVEKEEFKSKHDEVELDPSLVREGEAVANWWAQRVNDQTGEIRIVDENAIIAAQSLLKQGMSMDQIKTGAFIKLIKCRDTHQPAPRTVGDCDLR